MIAPMSYLTELRRLAERHVSRSFETAIPHLRIGRLLAPQAMPMVYEPMICLVLSGAKRIYVGKEATAYGEGQLFLSAADMPVKVEISVDAQRRDYLALVLKLSPTVVSDLAQEMGIETRRHTSENFVVANSDLLLLDAWRRLCELLDRPEEISIMAPAIEREIVFRLLRGERGRLLAEVVTADTKVREILAMAAWIRTNFATPFCVDELADRAHMSATVFHRWFKRVMGMSPLKYQKTIRLLEARCRLTHSPRSTSSVAHAVGYESASQFSREYKRMFGASPSQDLVHWRPAHDGLRHEFEISEP